MKTCVEPGPFELADKSESGLSMCPARWRRGRGNEIPAVDWILQEPNVAVDHCSDDSAGMETVRSTNPAAGLVDRGGVAV